MISVVIPTYQDGHLLGKCLASIANQTAMSTEVIIVDDGSTTVEAIEGLARAVEGHSVVVIRQPNAGPAAARNRGLRECTGEFIVFVDADDELTPNNLACKRAIFERFPKAVAVFGGFIAVTPDGNRHASNWRNYVGILEPDLVGRPGGLPGGLPLYMFRTAALREIGGLDESLRVMEDFDLIIRLGREGGIIAGSNELIYIRHIRELSISTGPSPTIFVETLRFLSKARRCRYFSTREILYRYTEALLRFIRRPLSLVAIIRFNGIKAIFHI